MKCQKCQFDNPESVKFCGECGAKLEKICLKCNSTNPPEFKFCGECGHDLEKPKEAPPVDYDQPQSYTPKHLADKILTTRSSIEGERKLVTVMFADAVDSTAIFENLDPEDVHQVMDGCFRIIMDEVHRCEGTVNQFRGDGVMALFGAPLAHEDHAQRACFATLGIQRAMKGYSKDMKARFGIDFKMRIGLDSGLVVVGSIGDDLRMDYTADGDTANVASRMESLAKPGMVLVSSNTYKLAENYFEFQSVGPIQVKGKKAPKEAYVLLRPSDVGTRIAASAVRGLTRFVGRKRELGVSREAFEKAKAGQGQVVGVVGEAGVGKSRLLFELRNALPQGEYTYLEGRCLHYGGTMPYLPILDVFRSYIGIKEGEQEQVIREKMKERILGLDENLLSVIPPIQELLSLKTDDEEYAKLDPKQKREKIFEAIRDLLVRGSQDRPILLAVEDLHWIDKTSEEALDYIIGWLPNASILLILLYRPEYTHQWGSKSYYSKIGVDQLSTDMSAELVVAILEGGEVTPEIRELIMNRSSGNPFFIEELTHSLLENGSVLKKEGQYVLKARPEDIQVPDTVQGVIAARLDRLDEDLKRVMQVASVIGREFAFRILHAVIEMKEDLKSSLFNLQGLEFVYGKSLIPELEYIFRHALTQEVAYNSLLLKRRKEIHEKIAQAIEKLYPERLEEFYEMLAYHYSKSDNVAKACEYLKASGDKAKGNFSTLESLRFYRQAVNMLRDQSMTHANKRKRLKILRAMAYPIRILGYPEGSFEYLEEGERLAQDLKDRKVLAHFHRNIGIYYLVSGGDPVKGREYIEKCLGESELTEEVEIIVPATSDLISSYYIEGNFARICQITPKIITLINKTHIEHELLISRINNMYSVLNGFYGISLGATGDFVEGELFLEKGLSLARNIDNAYSIAMGEMNYGAFYWLKGDGENMVKHFQLSIEFLEKSQMPTFLGPVWALLGFGYLFSCQIDLALQCAEKGLEIHTDLGIPLWLGLIHCILSEVQMDIDNLEKALVHADMAVDLSRKTNERFFEAEAVITLGRVIAATDRKKFEEAREQMRQGIGMLDELQMSPRYAVGLLHLGELYVQAGQKEEAIYNLKKAKAMFKKMGMDYWLSRAQKVLTAL